MIIKNISIKTHNKTLIEENNTIKKAIVQKNNIVSSVIHDAKSSLNGIIGFCRFVLISTKLDEMQQEYINLIQYSAHKLFNSLNMLSLKKSQNNGFSKESDNHLIMEIMENKLNHNNDTAIKGKYKLLIADDNDIIALLMNTILDDLNDTQNQKLFDIKIATNGKQAINFFKIWSPQIIIMDIKMPLIDGITAGKEIKEVSAQNTSESPYIIALSASRYKELENEALFNNYLLKPFTEEQLLDAIKKIPGISLDYNYEKQPELIFNQTISLKKEDIIKLNSEWLKKFKVAVDSIDVEESMQLLKEAPDDDPNTIKQLKALINTFRFDYLQSLLEDITQ